MRNRLLLLVTAALGAMAGSAVAQVTGVVTQATAHLQFSPNVDFGDHGRLTYTGQNIAGVVYDGSASTAQYQVTSDLQPNDIAFANGATATGPYQYTTTATSIAVTFTNNGPKAVRPELESTITPGGFGIYLADTSGCQLFSTAGCPQVAPATGLTFASLTRDPAAPRGTDLGGATFSFTVSSGLTVLESLSGSVTLLYNPADPGSPIVVAKLGALASTLAHFGLETPAGSASAIGYNWGATGLLVDFPPSQVDPGASASLTYTTVVSSYSRADCADACRLVAYGGFGDPIGLGGGSGGDLARTSGGSPLLSPAGDSALIQGVSYREFRYGLPTFNNGVLSLPLLTPVPEPGAWAVILLGTGLLGVALRRRRAPSRAPA